MKKYLKLNILRLTALLAAMIILIPVTAQEKRNRMLDSARAVMQDYRYASSFENINPGETGPVRESLFRNCFMAPNIIFDLPVKDSALTGQNDIKDKNPFTASYGHFIPVNRYINLVKALFEHYQLNKIDYEFIETAYDTTKLATDSIIFFEVEKKFPETSWSYASQQRYIFEVSFPEGGPKISAVRVHKTEPVKNEVTLLLDRGTKFRAGDLRTVFGGNLVARITINHDNHLYDKTITTKFDSTGTIRLGILSSRAKIIVDTAYGLSGEKFSIPYDWKHEGKQVSRQPSGGFPIALSPFRWNGWTFTIGINGGIIFQDDNNLANFSGVSSFDNKPGYSFGVGFSTEKYRNPDNFSKPSGGWIYGIGLGFSANFTRFSITGNQFEQNPYPFVDRSGDTANILFSGQQIKETVSVYILRVPLFLTARKKLSHSFYGLKSFGLQAGASLLVPFEGRYTTSGNFSRHGRYPIYNDQIITDDDFFNYYTGRSNNYNGNIQYHTMMAEGLIRLNGYFGKNNSDNSWLVGLTFGFPFTRSSSRETTQYRINVDNDIYNSLTYSKERIYRFYFGITIGWNVIRYKVD